MDPDSTTPTTTTLLADDLLGPTRPCPACAAPHLAVRGERWVCRMCGDGGTAVDLVVLATGAEIDVARATVSGHWRPSTGAAVRVPRGPALDPVEVGVPRSGGIEDVTLCLADAEVTVGEVAAAVGLPTESVAIDGRPVTRSTPVARAGLRRGSVLGGIIAGGPADSAAVLRWVGGPDAGGSVPLAAGVAVVGSAPWVEVRRVGSDVAPYHCLLGVPVVGPVRVTPLVADVVAVSARRWRIGNGVAEFALPVDADRRVVPTGIAHPGEWTVPLARPPRPAAPPAPAAVRAPRADDRIGAFRPGMAGLVTTTLSLAGGVMAAMLFRQPALLLLGGMGAIGSIGTWVAQRRRGARASGAARRRVAAELVRFRAEIAGQAVAAGRARWARTVDLADAVAIGAGHDRRLWERRAGHDDYLEVVLGVGDVSWTPLVDGLAEEPSAEVVAALADRDRLEHVPVTLALRPGTVLGVVGDEVAARAVARSLVIQAAVMNGPADVAISVITERAASEWAWTSWLPQTVDLVDEIADRTRLVVVDGAEVVAARTSPARAALVGRYGPAAGVVVARDAHSLPAYCTHVAHVEADATLRLVDVRDGSTIDGVAGAGASVATASSVARSIARFDDPELASPGTGLPTSVDLLDVLGADVLDAAALAVRWGAADPDPPARAPIAVSADGLVELDLVEHGPHALVAGTTGAGKSELLRALVAGLAARSSPRDLTFVLVDYKGGSAFDACARLPHVVGVVTDLDDRLAGRALRSLEAEIRRRERSLRAAGATDLAAYRRAPTSVEPMPRLVVVIDEFAGLAADLPDFLASLVGVAQRGRSLGIHLVLATQRPAGVVNDDIRANTNLRIALRVQDATDSADVIGTAEAAHLPRDRPGRAVVRLGPSDLVHVQVARASTPARTAAVPAVEVVAMGARPTVGPAVSAGAPTTLDRLAAAACEAARRLELPPPRRPWLDSLPDVLALDAVPLGAVALADDPDRQSQTPVGWDRSEGHLLLYGVVGSGTTTALASLALAITSQQPPAALHLYVVDMGAGDLAPLATLPHCAAVVRAPERERQARLIRRLRAEVDERRSAAAALGWPEIVVLIDGLEALRAGFDDPAGYALLDALDRLIADGPEVGVRVVATADRPGAIPASLTAGIRQRWIFRLADQGDARSFGVAPSALTGAPPGRAVMADCGLEIQIGWPQPSLVAACAQVAAMWDGASGEPEPIGVLPSAVSAASLPAPNATVRPWSLPVGIGDADLAPAALALHRGDHVLVTGRARSGRSSALVLLADRFRLARPDAVVAAVAYRPSPLRSCGADVVLTEASGLASLTDAVGSDRPALVLVDDAELVDDDGTLAALLASGSPELHVAAAGRPDALRSMYGHWTHVVRRSRLGVLLQPDVDVDGDLLGAVLPRRQSVPPLPGRGYVVIDGRAELIQLAHI